MSFESMDAFLQSVERRAYVTAFFATRHREDALDIVQNAMTDLFQRYGRKPESDWAPLFHCILHSRIRDWARRRASYRQRFTQWWQGGEDTAEPEADDVHFGSPEQALEAERTQDRFLTLLAALPLQQKQVFMLRVWEEMDTATTARAMGISTGSVKTHLSRAMKALAPIMESEHAR